MNASLLNAICFGDWTGGVLLVDDNSFSHKKPAKRSVFLALVGWMQYKEAPSPKSLVHYGFDPCILELGFFQ